MIKSFSKDLTADMQAKAWIDTLNSKNQWRVERLVRRSPSVSGTTSVTPPVRLRRFAEGCPPSGMRAAMEYLVSLAPYSGVVVNGDRLSGTYRPTLTMWKRDDQDVIHGKAPVDGTYTLVQDLVDSRVSDDYDAASAESCSEEVVTTWTWDAPGIDTSSFVPEQGVTYAVQSVNRADDGTFSYALVKRRAKTQDSGRTLSKSTYEGNVYVHTWNNLYGDPETGFYDHTGSPVPVPATSSSQGRSVERHVRENDDCTFTVEVTETESIPRYTARSSKHTIFEGEHRIEADGATSNLGFSGAASGGVIRQWASKLNPDGTFVNIEDVVKEIPVSESVVEMSVTRKGRRQTVEHRNQSAPASFDAIGTGGSVRVEKTPGGLYINRISSWVRTASPVKVGETCSRTQFVHEHGTTKAGVTMPSDASHVSWGRGVTESRRTDMDDEGSISQTVVKKTEQPVANQVKSVRVGLHGVVTRVKNLHQSSSPTMPSYSLANIGKQVEVEKTEGGLYNVTTTSVQRPASAVDVQNDCQKSAYEHTTVTSASSPTSVVPNTHVDGGTGGHVRARRSRMTDDGSVVTTTEDREELPVLSSKVSYRKNAKRTIVETVDTNVSVPASPPAGIGEESHEKTPGGLYVRRKVTVDVHGSSDYQAKESTIFEDKTTDRVCSLGTTAVAPPVSSGGGTYRSSVARVDDDGVMSADTTVITEKPVSNAIVTYRKTPYAIIRSHTDRNTAVGLTAPTLSSPVGEYSQTKNPGGTNNVTVVDSVQVLPQKARQEERRTAFEKTLTTDEGHASFQLPNVPPASGGVYYDKKEETRADGTVSHVEVQVTELPVTTAEKSSTDTRFKKTVRTLDRNINSVPPDISFSEGKIVTQERSTTPGKLHNYTETIVAAKEVSWDDEEISLVRLYRIGSHFRNYSRERIATAVRVFISKLDAKLRTWDSLDRYPHNVAVNPSTTMNEFGLYDTDIVAVCTWAGDSAGQNGAVDKEYCRVDYRIVRYSYSSRGVTKQSMVTVASKHESKHTAVWGRGRNMFRSYVNGKKLYDGSSFSFNPATSNFSVNLVTEEGSVTTEWKEGS